MLRLLSRSATTLGSSAGLIASLVLATVRPAAADVELAEFFRPPPPGPRITIHADYAPLRTVLHRFERVLGVHFSVDPDVDERVTVRADDEDAAVVLASLLVRYRLARDWPDGRIRRMSVFEERSARADGPETTAALERARARIEAELATLPADHPWAGKYESLSGFASAHFWVAPNAGFVEWWSDCTGRPLAAWGKVEYGAQSRLVLRPEGAESRGEPARLEPVWLVPWGPELYAVAGDQLLRFVNAVNAGWRGDRDSARLFPVRSRGATDEEPLPHVPEPFAGLVRTHAVRARITELVATKLVRTRAFEPGEVQSPTHETRFEVEFERPGDAFAGMTLEPESGDGYRELVVDEVHGPRGLVVLRHYASDLNLPGVEIWLTSRRNRFAE